MDEQLRKDIDKKLYLNEKCREITVSLDEYRNLVSLSLIHISEPTRRS